MPFELTEMVKNLIPEETVLFFGSGASMPCGAPSGVQLAAHIAKKIGRPDANFNLIDAATMLELKSGRQALIDTVREKVERTKLNGGIRNIHIYNWKNIFTTNYDTLIEQAYQSAGKSIAVCSSDFQFGPEPAQTDPKLFKIHGSIDKDLCDGSNERIIITQNDYKETTSFRNALYDTLKSNLNQSHCVIIGHSLADPHIREIIDRSIQINQISYNECNIYLLMFTEDIDLALLYESQGLRVCFASIDDFFAAMSDAHEEYSLDLKGGEKPLDCVPELTPCTTEVFKQPAGSPNVASMFNGWPPSYVDIHSGLTFHRTVTDEIFDQLQDNNEWISLILGVSGVGKTTIARQVLSKLSTNDIYCWEHNSNFELNPSAWKNLGLLLSQNGQSGVLLVDDAHTHLYALNELAENLIQLEDHPLKLILCSSKNHWNPRVKTPSLSTTARSYEVSQLDNSELDRLISLVEENAEIRCLVENDFAGFSRHEKKRRLSTRCEADMFVCLRNIFASEKFDDILLREFSSLDNSAQEVYKYVAALQDAGVNVHRQLVIRVLGLPAEQISNILANLEEIVLEYEIDAKNGIYGWRGRHPVITSIISKYKFGNPDDYISLFKSVIDAIVPTYNVEQRTLISLCNLENGIKRLQGKPAQNKLLGQMISKVPGLRVPRHRLIQNLIEMNEFEKAETEIRLFEKDFGIDGPVFRYKVILLTARAERAPGLMEEDRQFILNEALAKIRVGISKYKTNRYMYSTYCDVSLSHYKKTNDPTVVYEAMDSLRAAESEIGDPDFSNTVKRYERKLGLAGL